MIPWIQSLHEFPPVDSARAEPNGLLCTGADLLPETLVAAYSRGIFPWFSDDQPILWWSPDPRMVLFPDEFKMSKSLRKTLQSFRPGELLPDLYCRDYGRGAHAGQ